MKNNFKGFTLIELLVVIAILAVLAVAVVIVLNPAELIRQGRDSTRLSDLAALNSAIALWLSDVQTSTFPTNVCRYTLTNATPTMSGCTGVTSTSVAVDGTGWVNINFTLISSGSPLSKLPIDPLNKANSCRTAKNSGFTLPCQYAFAASSSPGFYELNAAMESNKYAANGDADVVTTDGGNSNVWYEIGSDVRIFN